MQHIHGDCQHWQLKMSLHHLAERAPTYIKSTTKPHEHVVRQREEAPSADFCSSKSCSIAVLGSKEELDLDLHISSLM